MLSVLLASVLVQQSASEPKLEWSTFGDFAAKQFEGSEYRLVMDREIGDRPMVYYFSNPGSDKLTLLKRSCKELCLNYDVDDKLKKIFIAGPNSDAGLTLRMKLQLSIKTAQEIIRANWSYSNARLDSEREKLIGQRVPGLSAKEESLINLQMGIVSTLKSSEGKAVLACILSADPVTLSSQMAKNHSGRIFLNRNSEAAQILEQKFIGAPPADSNEAEKWEEDKNSYLDMVKDEGVLAFSYSSTKGGAATFFIRMIGRTQSKNFGAFSLLLQDWLNEFDKSNEDIVPEALASEPYNPKQTIFWGVQGLNVFQTLAIKHEWNTVAWLDMFPIQEESINNIKSFRQTRDVRVKLTQDGWMIPYIRGERWPEFSGDWHGVMKMEGYIQPETKLSRLIEYLESLTSEEINGMARIEGEGLDYRVNNLARKARLLRTALRVSKEMGQNEFDIPVSQLNLETGAELSHYWPSVTEELLTTPAVIERRGQARLILVNRNTTEPESTRTLMVMLWVPKGVNNSDGSEKYAVDACDIPLKN